MLETLCVKTHDYHRQIWIVTLNLKFVYKLLLLGKKIEIVKLYANH